MTAYGVPGCRCDREFTWGDRQETWHDNASCPYHGLLPRDRMDTGVYRVVAGPCERHPGASTIAGLCAMCSRRPEDVITTPVGTGWGRAFEGEYVEPQPCPPGECSESGACPRECPANPMDCPGMIDGECMAPTTEEKERGVLAAVRRWYRGVWCRTLFGCHREH